MSQCFFLELVSFSELKWVLVYVKECTEWELSLKKRDKPHQLNLNLF